MAWRAGLRWRVTAAAIAALAVTGVALAIALAAADQVRAAGRELDQRLIPAAAAAGVLLQDYTTQAVVLRNYLTSGAAGQLAEFREAGREIPRVQAQLGRLLRGYPWMPGRLAAVVTALRAWDAHVASPQLAAAARGDFRLALAMQNNIALTRPYGLAVRSRGSALQAQITTQQGAVTGRLLGSQRMLIGALIAICVLVVVIAAGGVVVVRRWLLRPFTALRQAAEAVAAGHYDRAIPAQGPAEFAALVYGIITQAGGIQIYSEPGLGTTISALLPAAAGAPAPVAAVPPPGSGGLRGHGEAILLVEDEESLRELAYRILTRNDYRVHQAPNAPHAVFFASNPAQRIDLLLTDIVMPDMLGTQVAAQIRQHRPSLPVLYMSGYAQPVLDSYGAARASMDIVESPSQRPPCSPASTRPSTPPRPTRAPTARSATASRFSWKGRPCRAGRRTGRPGRDHARRSWRRSG